MAIFDTTFKFFMGPNFVEPRCEMKYFRHLAGKVIFQQKILSDSSNPLVLISFIQYAESTFCKYLIVNPPYPKFMCDELRHFREPVSPPRMSRFSGM